MFSKRSLRLPTSVAFVLAWLKKENSLGEIWREWHVKSSSKVIRFDAIS
jgi:hypothetical protein